MVEPVKEMSFLDHLEELRWHVIRGFGAVLVLAIAAFARPDLVFDRFILGPSRPDFITYRALCWLGRQASSEGLCIDKLNFTIQNRTMTGQFSTHIWISFLTGFILAFPYVFWEVWRFIRPALSATEMRLTRGAVAFVTVLFAAGVSFGYYVVSPMSINFLANYQISEQIENFIDLSSYISTVTMMVLACGVMFQLPTLVLVLTRAGIVTPAFLRYYRRHAFVVILIVAAILTPSPDMFSQLLLGLPLYLLYELSIVLSGSSYRQLRAAEKEAILTSPGDTDLAIS